VDDSAAVSYAGRLWDFFRGLFYIEFSVIFNLFKIEEDFQSYFDCLEQTLNQFAPGFCGCCFHPSVFLKGE